jgi:hypothetical protein
MECVVDRVNRSRTVHFSDNSVFDSYGQPVLELTFCVAMLRLSTRDKYFVPSMMVGSDVNFAGIALDQLKVSAELVRIEPIVPRHDLDAEPRTPER